MSNDLHHILPFLMAVSIPCFSVRPAVIEQPGLPNPPTLSTWAVNFLKYGKKRPEK